jgi:hypothetical protein
MKPLSRFLAVLLVCLVALTAHAKGIDVSQSTVLERYTLIDGDTFQYDTGFLYLDGTFHVITSETDYYSFYGITPDDLAPFSGKPIMNEELYNSYHDLGIIPKWTRSQADFSLGFFTYVIVAVVGKGDPNPSVTITTQPESDWTFLGSPAFFYVEAEPWGYLTYQWYLNSKPIPGATSDSLWINSVTKTQGGVYKCAVSSGGTPVMSQGALLTIITPITIKKQPSSVTTKAGKKALFKVLVAGTPPFHYQWYSGTNLISGATNASYTIPKVQVSDAGFYWVAADNIHTFIPSSLAQLTVTP